MGGERLKDEDRDLYINKNKQPYLFYCAVGSGDGFSIDPYGNAFLCNLIRRPKFSFVKTDIEWGLKRLLGRVREKEFLTNSKCKNCSLKKICGWCPGRAYLEKGDMEVPVEYYCRLAKLVRIMEKRK